MGTMHGASSGAMPPAMASTMSTAMSPAAQPKPGTDARRILAVALPQGVHVLAALRLRDLCGLLHLGGG